MGGFRRNRQLGTAGMVASPPARLLRQWDWALYGLILLYMALPQVYRSYSVYLIGNAIPDTSALATVAQWGFIELMIEVVQETFVLGIFFFVGRKILLGGHPGYPMRTALSIIFWVSLAFAFSLFVAAHLFVDVIGTPESIQQT